MNKLLISPSILSADFLHLGRDLAEVSAAGADCLHLDVMDGHFVPNLSFGMPVINAVARVSSLPLGVHLMVENGPDYIDPCAKAGVRAVTLHAEATTHLHRALGQVRDRGMLAGVALNPGTSPEFLTYLKSVVDYVLVMSVNPGYSGQKFISEALNKISRIREILGAEVRIGVDGGVNAEFAPACVEAGADVLIAATAVFGQSDYTQAISALRVR